jgi:L-alanine-DL-glutamate epimerase-like enolase superfamily enzyme
MAPAAENHIRWYEEPVTADDLDGLRELRDTVDADVTAGEDGHDLYSFRRMCAAGAVDCLHADISRCGGITEWLRVAAVAASFGLQISGHCAPHLHAHAAAATPNLRHLEWFHDHVRTGARIQPDDAAPGLGLSQRHTDIDHDRIA